MGASRRRLRVWPLAAVLVVSGALGTAGSVANAAAAPATSMFSAGVAAPTTQEAVASGVAAAADQDIEQAVSVLDRTTGELLVSSSGDQVFSSESILKLFTASYYLIQADGQPDADLVETLSTMIELSDNGIQSSLWKEAIVPTIAERYGLTDTRNANNASSRNWGSGRITADDQVKFLYAMSQDPLVAPSLMAWMAATAPAGSDEFDQFFGLNAMPGDHGSKQGWSDPGSTPYNLHSVGWTGQYFVAILQTSPSAGTTALREASTNTATLITAAMTAVVEQRAADTAALCDGGAAAGPLFDELTAAVSALLQNAGGVTCPE